MRIRRFTEGKEFWSNLEAETSDVLPIWFAEAERDWIARTVAPQVAMLAAGNEYSFANCSIRCGSDDWVLAAPSGPETLLARRYAAATARPLVLTDGHSVPAAFAGRTPRSLTWFCQLDERDIPGALDALCRTLSAAFGKVPPLGVLTAEDAAKLSWLTAKQVLPRGDDGSVTATLVSLDDPAPQQSSLVQLGKSHAMADVVAAMHGAAGTLLINAHSRAHCGHLKVADGAMGICGLETGGAGGRCVGGTACFFGEGPRAVVQNFQSRRVFFNGCTTAGVGTHRRDLLPRNAMVSHAALRGAAREFIGNVWPGLYDETDLDWFLGASALGYGPAECVEVIATARAGAGRETVRSALYFGDATNGAWPVDGVATGDVAIAQDGPRIHWPRAERVLVARVPGRAWADLAACDRLYAATPHPSQPTISVIADPFGAASIVLAVPRAAAGDATEIEIALGVLAEPIDRSIGGALAGAIAHIAWLEALPAFGQVLANAARQLDEQLVTLRRAAGSRADLAMLPHLIAYLRNMEDEAARRFDGLVIDEALVRSQGYWNWQMEYGARVKATPRQHPSPCPFCAASANDVDYADWANPSIRRTSKACGYCGIIADLPAWDLRVRFVPETLAASAMKLTGAAEVANDGDRPRRVTLGAVVERAGEVRPESVRKGEVLVAPGETASFAFSLIPVKPMSEIYQMRLYAASEGAFAALSTFVLCPPDG